MEIVASQKSILDKPCQSLKGVGPQTLQKLQKLGLHTFKDFMLHLPIHYQDRTHVLALRDVKVGQMAVIEGCIENVKLQQARKRSLIVTLRDHHKLINLRFFHFRQSQVETFVEGGRLRCFGEVRMGFKGLEMVHPEYRHLQEHETVKVDEHLTPVYPATEGLSQQTLRQLIGQVLQVLSKETLPDYLPSKLRDKYDLPHLVDALRYVHLPPPDASKELLEQFQHLAQRRLIFEELLVYQLGLKKLRMQSQQLPTYQLTSKRQLLPEFLKLLPFQLTSAQQRVFQEIEQDLQCSVPMMRLVQGDVGSGKTVVAALAILIAVESGYQAALMAPTDILAEQHYKNLSTWLEPLNISVAWLAGKHKGKIRKQTLACLEEGQAQVVIGTHALFQEQVSFKNLSLVVIDEQHRFGVDQRLALTNKGVNQELHPHQLVMTATPIPRTLAMTFYADLDVSVIDELPPGRKPIKTVVLPNIKRDEIIDRIRQQCAEKKQVYWVCTLIEESEVLENQAAQDLWESLVKCLPELRIGLVHGRLKPEQKEQIMQDFKQHHLDVLVATTVIEVGVDVPNASLMIIENAERLGLSQLHQLRGRVGRGSQESFCVLLYQHPLSETAKKRLQIMRESSDGFKIAEADLEIRGPGELLGTRQTGAVQFKIANIARDQYMLGDIQRFAQEFMRDYSALLDQLIERWVPKGDEYGRV